MFLVFLINLIINRDYRVGVHRQHDVNDKKKKRTAVTFAQLSDSYIAAEIPKTDVKADYTFVIGDGKTYGPYYNPPLVEEATYKIYIGLTSRVNETVINI